MKSKYTTPILFVIMIVLIVAIVLLCKMIYNDLFAETSSQSTYKLHEIITEEKEQNTNIEFVPGNLSDNIQSTSNSNTMNSDTNTDSGSKNSRYFYNQLNDTQQTLYNGLNENKENLKQGNYVIEFGNEFSDILEEDLGTETLGDDFQSAIEAFTHDNPDLFFLDVNKMYLNIEATTRFLKTTYRVYISAAEGQNYWSEEFTSLEQIKQAEQEIEKVKNQIISNLKGTDYQKILYIHDYLINNIEYDSTYAASGSYSIYGALVGKTCVCEGYAKAFKYLANSAGFECEIMQGEATNSSGVTESHAWNCININGTWYGVDSTWDDPIVTGGRGTVSDNIKYKYFLKGTDTFDKDHFLSYQFSEGGKSFSYPSMSQTDY